MEQKFSRKTWTIGQRRLLMERRAKGVSYRDIAAEVGHSWRCCAAMACYIKKGKKPIKPKPKMPPEHKPRAASTGGRIIRGMKGFQPTTWTDDDTARMIHMREVEGMRFRDIDAALGLRSGASWDKYDRLGRAPPVARISDAAIAEREARAAARYRRSLTAEHMGDPPPGYSALDKKRAGIAEPDAVRRSDHNRVPVPVSLATEAFKP